MRRFLWIVGRMLLVIALATVVFSLVRSRSRSARPERTPGAPFPFPPVDRDGRHLHVPDVIDPGGGPETGATVVTEAPWMEPVDGACPATHPVKAKLASGIYHEPGGRNYDRTNPDRCYVDAAAAEADGLRAAKA
jgi:hypothetical protein